MKMWETGKTHNQTEHHIVSAGTVEFNEQILKIVFACRYIVMVT